MAFYNENEQLCLETDVLGVGVRVSLLQVRDRMWFLRNKALNNAAPRPPVCVNKRLTCVET